LGERYPQVPKEELDELVVEGLVLAKYELERERE
jgi:hypothetical protein